MLNIQNNQPGGFVVFSHNTSPEVARNLLVTLHQSAGGVGKPILLRDNHTGTRGGAFGGSVDEIMQSMDLWKQQCNRFQIQNNTIIGFTINAFRKLISPMGYGWELPFNRKMSSETRSLH